jgi:hypothetical protein
VVVIPSDNRSYSSCDILNGVFSCVTAVILGRIRELLVRRIDVGIPVDQTSKVVKDFTTQQCCRLGVIRILVG